MVRFANGCIEPLRQSVCAVTCSAIFSIAWFNSVDQQHRPSASSLFRTATFATSKPHRQLTDKAASSTQPRPDSMNSLWLFLAFTSLLKKMSLVNNSYVHALQKVQRPDFGGYIPNYNKVLLYISTCMLFVKGGRFVTQKGIHIGVQYDSQNNYHYWGWCKCICDTCTRMIQV